MEAPRQPRLHRLADADNVAVAAADIAAGQTVSCGSLQITLPQPVAFGHKVAIQPIHAGEKVRKFACPIGSATRDIAVGEHVHTHNLKSDYLPTFTLEDGRRFVDHAAETTP